MSKLFYITLMEHTTYAVEVKDDQTEKDAEEKFLGQDDHGKEVQYNAEVVYVGDNPEGGE